MEEVKQGLTMDKMSGILRIMIKTPEVMPVSNDPEAHPRIITDLKLMSDGTVRTYIEGEKYPIRFFTPHNIVDAVAIYKRVFSHLIGAGLWGWIALYFNKNIWIGWLQRVFDLNTIALKEQHYSQPVKEIRRILKGRLEPIIVDAISGIIQNDMAYCYRMQDILSELNKKDFDKNPIKEIKRLILLAEKRDIGAVILHRIKKYLPLVSLLRLRPKLLKQIKEIVADLNQEEIKLSPEDIYWTNIVPNYQYRGIPYEERIKEYNLAKEEFKKSVDKNDNNSTTNI